MGGSGSKLEKALSKSSFPENERLFGFENFGNTCYCNSVLQAMYFCVPFRDCMINYCRERKNKARTKASEEESDTLLMCLGELFLSISTQKKRTGVIAPKKFVQKLRKENEMFRGHMHQDAHEFHNYVLNEIIETLKKECANAKPSAGPPPLTFVQQIFEGVLTNETKCLCCETITSRDETFLDLSLDIEENCSITHCLRNFSSTEMLNKRDKFFCDQCCSLQEAQKRMKVKKLPQMLVLHLKRFKYIEHLQRFKKLSYRVVFPHDLRVVNTSDEVEDPDLEYCLCSVVVHVGSGLNYGHYINLTKVHQNWLLFDDDNVEPIEDSDVASCFGCTQDTAQSSETGYLLFYQAVSAMPSASSEGASGGAAGSGGKEAGSGAAR